MTKLWHRFDLDRHVDAVNLPKKREVIYLLWFKGPLLFTVFVSESLPSESLTVFACVLRPNLFQHNSLLLAGLQHRNHCSPYAHVLPNVCCGYNRYPCQSNKCKYIVAAALHAGTQVRYLIHCMLTIFTSSKLSWKGHGFHRLPMVLAL